MNGMKVSNVNNVSNTPTQLSPSPNATVESNEAFHYNSNTHHHRKRHHDDSDDEGADDGPLYPRQRGCLSNWNICSPASSQKTASTKLSAPVSAGFTTTTIAQVPHRDNEVTEGQRLIVQELNRLTFQEREKAYDDVHGVADEHEETPEFVEATLQQMQHRIDHFIPDDQKDAYLQANVMSPKYCNSRRLRLAFLRACRFDPQECAQRFTAHFQMKRKHFGRDKLVKDITMEDLDEDDKETLYSGGMCLFSNNKDRAGRTVLFNMLRLVKYKTADQSLKAIWYMDMKTIMHDEMTQKKGFVIVAYVVGPNGLKYFDVEQRKKVVELIACLPLRVSAVHFCYNDPALVSIISLVQAKFHKSVMIRYRTHFGSHTECQYALMQFGIPAMILPLDGDGNFKRELFARNMEWFILHDYDSSTDDQPDNDTPVNNMALTKSLPTTAPKSKITSAKNQDKPKKAIKTSDLVRQVNPTDVLFGRGRPIQSHPGNIEFLAILDEHRTAYDSARNDDKKTISGEVIRIVKGRKGRFLKQCKGGTWEEATDDEARLKVSNAFRTRRHLAKKTASANDPLMGVSHGFTPVMPTRIGIAMQW